MAASKLILSHTRRHFTTTTTTTATTSHTSLSSLLLRHSSPNLQSSSPSNLPTFFKSSFLGFHRFSSSSSSPTESENSNPINSPPSPPPQSPQPVSYAPKPVSYAPKPTDPSPSELSEKPNSPEFRRPRESSPLPPRSSEGVRGWTREDIRYVKNVQSVSISPVSYQVRVANLPEDRPSTAEEEEKGKEDEQLERERRRIETEPRLRRAIRAEEGSSTLPFPSLIKVEKKKSKVVLDLQEAIREVKANAKRNFVETIEAHVGLGVDPKRGDQMVRGATTLPHGTGKVVRVAVFAEGEVAEEARAAGADIVGAEELIEEIRKGGGKINFDKCIATPIFMPRLGKIARILGPRGLMPNPKLGSVTSDVAGAVREAKRGRIDFKIDKTAIVHVGLGKVNFPDEALRENVGAFVNGLLLAKPVGLKKTSKYAGYVNSFSLCSTMGPAFPVSIQSLSMAADHYNKLQLK